MSTGGEGPLYRDGVGKLWAVMDNGTHVAVDESVDRQWIGGALYINDPGPCPDKTYIDWISIEDDLPRVGRDVLATDGRLVGIVYRSYEENIWEYVAYPVATGIVTHWAYYPDPPRSKK